MSWCLYDLSVFLLSWWCLWNFKTLIFRNFVQLPIDRLSLCCHIIMYTGGIWRLLPSLKKSLVTAYGLTTIISLSVAYYACWYSTDVFGICIGQSPAGLKARSKGVNDLSDGPLSKIGKVALIDLCDPIIMKRIIYSS